MRKRRRFFVGNKATLISIILIIGMSFIANLNMPGGNKAQPGYVITYMDHGYTYVETIKASPYKFVKAKERSEEGFTVLLMRKDKKAQVPEEIYIYLGRKKYMKYVLTIDTN